MHSSGLNNGKWLCWRRSAVAATATVAAVLAAAPATGQENAVTDGDGTFVSENISTDTVWKREGSPFRLSRTIKVESGTKLTVEPGVAIEGSGFTYFEVEGTVELMGAEAAPVTMTQNPASPNKRPNQIFEVPPGVDGAGIEVRHLKAVLGDGGYSFATLGSGNFEKFVVADSNVNASFSVDASKGKVQIERNAFSDGGSQPYGGAYGGVYISNPNSSVKFSQNRFRWPFGLGCSGAGTLTASGNVFERGTSVSAYEDCRMNVASNHWEMSDADMLRAITNADTTTVHPRLTAPAAGTATLPPGRLHLGAKTTDQYGRTSVVVNTSSNGGLPSEVTAAAVDRDTGATVESATFSLPETGRSAEFNARFERLLPGRLYRIVATASNSRGQSYYPPETASFVGPARSTTPPGDVSVDQVDREVRISWTAPEFDFGSAVQKYRVELTDEDGGSVLASKETSSLTADFQDLRYDIQYRARVVAINDVGDSPPSSRTPTFGVATPPPVPVRRPVARPLDGAASVSWVPQSDQPSFVHTYEVTASPSGKSCRIAAPATACEVKDLQNGTPYTFTVSSFADAGGHSTSEASEFITPQSPPAAVAPPTVVRGDGKATVRWKPLTTEGLPVDGYTVTSNVAGRGCSAPAGASSCVVTGLRNGTGYYFAVRARNAIGLGEPSGRSAKAVPAGVPKKVGKPKARASKRSATVSWRAPSSNGSTISSYRVTSSSGKTVVVGSSKRSVNVKRLVRGKRYSFTVVAVNKVGRSVKSTKSDRVRIK